MGLVFLNLITQSKELGEVMNWQQRLFLFLKGMAMGAADVVPGVSGGTIAFVTGIYEMLLDSLKAFTPRLLIVLKQQGFRVAWEQVNGQFLLVLFAGILTSVLTLVRVISFLLEHHPHLLWSFFFGLILISAILIARQIARWGVAQWLLLLVGIASAFLITELSPVEVEATYLIIFLSGSLAICAMILPGISGSFILLLLGMYAHVINAIKSLDLIFIALFGGGCVVGLICFSHVLSWMFKHYRCQTLALLTGFLIGSLNKVWPWKETIATRINSHGEEVPLIQKNISPFVYENIAHQDPQLITSVILFLLGFGVVWILDHLFAEKSELDRA